MDELIAFLAARLDEDEAVAWRNIGSAPGSQNGLGDTKEFGPGWPDYQTFDGDEIAAANDYIDRFRPLRMLREVAAKRAIVERAAVATPHERGALTTVLRYLALPYDDHPDYRQEWKP